MEKKKKLCILIIGIIGILALIGLGYFLYFKNTYLSKEEIKNIIVKDTKLAQDEISFTEVELELDGETKKYEVEFYYNKVEYHYEVDAKTGKIIFSDFPVTPNSNSSSSSNSSTDYPTNTEPTDDYITAEEAKKIALEDAGISSSILSIDVDFEYEQGVALYEVEFETNTLEYDYKIDAKTKQIIHKEQGPRD